MTFRIFHSQTKQLSSKTANYFDHNYERLRLNRTVGSANSVDYDTYDALWMRADAVHSSKIKSTNSEMTFHY